MARERISVTGMHELLKEAKEGNVLAEEELFRRLLVRFTAIAKRRIGDEHAGDIAQEACMTVLQKYRKTDFKTSFEAWAYRIVRNKILNHFQTVQRQRKMTSLDSSRFHLDLPASPPQENDLKQELIVALKRISRRHPRYARMIVLSYQGYNGEEICRRLKISRNNFYVSLKRGRTMLKESLRRGGC